MELISAWNLFHLFRYVDEQAFRFNNRTDMTDSDRFDLAVRQIIGKRLTWGRSHRQGAGKTRDNQLGRYLGVRSGRRNAFPFRLGTAPVRILRRLLAMFFHALLYDAVRNRQHAIH
jgi:hypothetical protein